MRPTQVNLLGPKSRDKYPSMRQNIKDKYTEEEAMKTEAEFEETRQEFLLEYLKGVRIY